MRVLSLVEPAWQEVVAFSALTILKGGNTVIKAGDLFKNIESGKVFTVRSVKPSIIILSTRDESHSMLVNLQNIESAFLPLVEDEIKGRLK